MILLRKNFSKYSKLPDLFPIPDEWEGKYDEIVVDVDVTDRYNLEVQGFTDSERKLIKEYRKDLKKRYLYSDNPLRPNGMTEYLEEFSQPYSKVNPFHRLTKRINYSDRFDYIVYPPILDEINRKVIIPVVIQSLRGHNIAGQTTYSKID